MRKRLTILPMSVGTKRRAVHLHVLAILERGDDGGVGGGPADAVLLQRLHQRGLAVARRRLGEVLLGAQRVESHRIALAHRRQHVIAVLALAVVRALLIHRDVAGLDQGGTVGAQQVALRPIGAGEQVDRDRVIERVAHLRGDRALPDERVEPIKIVVDLALHVRGRDGGRGRPYGLVRLLRVLRLCLVYARLDGYSALPYRRAATSPASADTASRRATLSRCACK